MKKNFLLFLVLLASAACVAADKVERPKLVVGIVVDQMRWDYLYRYYDKFVDGGLKRLMNEGYNCENTHYNYVPTVTAAGHASVYTGSTPAIHGIAGNNYHLDGKPIYCVDDPTVQGVGTTSKAGLMSPRNLLATTIGDQLRLATDFRSRVFGVALKDRASILPAGHSANAAYWFDSSVGGYITSDYYMKELPSWVKSFNRENKVSEKEDVKIKPKGLQLTTKMALAVLDNERLGRQDNVCDMLCISYSSTDIMGHEFGTRGPQTDEMYLALDKEIRQLLEALDSRIGKNKYLVFLTADHAGGHNAKFLNDNKLPGGQVSFGRRLKESINQTLAEQFGGINVIDDIMGEQVYIDCEAVEKAGQKLCDVKRAVCNEILKNKDVQYAVPVSDVMTAPIPAAIRDRIVMGHCPRRSGDIYIIPRPHFYNYRYEHGTSHSHWNPYDTHVPFILMGWHVEHGSTNQPVTISDIAPTVCAMLKIQMPSGCVGNPVF